MWATQLSVELLKIHDAMGNILLPHYMQSPTTAMEWKHVCEGFEQIWNFHIVCELLMENMYSCKLPHILGPLYLIRKVHIGYVVLLAVCDAGRHSDGGDLSNSAFRQALQAGE